MRVRMIRRKRQVEAPITASQRMPSWVLEFTLSEVGEPRPPAEGVGRSIRNRGEGVKKSVHVLAPKPFDQQLQGGARVAPALILREDHPARLIDDFLPPRLVPIADVADRICRGTQDDLEHLSRTGCASDQVTLVLIHDLLATLGTAEVLHHLRIGKESSNGPEIIVGPRHQLDHVSQGILSVVTSDAGNVSAETTDCPSPPGRRLHSGPASGASSADTRPTRSPPRSPSAITARTALYRC